MTLYFASEEASGISSLGLNGKAFLFQLITFVIIMWILNKFALSKIFRTLDARRAELEQSLDDAAAAKQALATADEKAAEALGKAHREADTIVAAAKTDATKVMQEAEQKAALKAERIVADAKTQLDSEVQRAQHELKAETAKLVTAATEVVLNEKLTTTRDQQLIQDALTKVGAK